MRWLRDNGLSLFFGAIFLLTVLGQSFAGQHALNEDQVEHGSDPVSWGRYLVSSQFGRAVLENWQSEYLQFVLFTLATVWLVQRGSNESKQPGDEGLESDEEQLVGEHARPDSPSWAKAGGWRTRIYSSSFLIVMLAIFFASWGGQLVTGRNDYNDDQREHDQPSVTLSQYLGRPDFWEQTLQNWQSEFLAVGTMAIFTVYLRQRGSPESKPVGAPHAETGTSG